jgi:hypothetical protein
MSISRCPLLASTAWSALAGAAPARRSLAQAEVSETADDFTDRRLGQKHASLD